MFGKRKTDNYKREYWNSLFTEIQYIRKRLHSWDYPVDAEGKKQADDNQKMNILLIYHQILSQKNYTNWFIGLMITNIFLVLTGIILTIYLRIPY